ncbi:MAG: STAS domain-containing protein [Microbacteriaceae bacterium]
MTKALSNDINSRSGSVQLETSTEWHDIDLAVVAVSGEIDAANTRELLDYTLGKVLLCRRLVLDLSRVGFFSSDGYWMLKTLESRCTLADVELTVVLGARVGRALHICGQADQHAS